MSGDGQMLEQDEASLTLGGAGADGVKGEGGGDQAGGLGVGRVLCERTRGDREAVSSECFPVAPLVTTL